MTDYSSKITALEDALASGELTVESDGERVTYRSVTDLKAALDYFSGKNGGSGVTGDVRPATTVAYYDPR
ncbi:MAG: hypothetical protein C0494_16965 [Sphingobium sp.]|nr:hypothetical protein [Sphingobium sp.]